jgi:hypothetical protein
MICGLVVGSDPIHAKPFFFFHLCVGDDADGRICLFARLVGHIFSVNK